MAHLLRYALLVAFVFTVAACDSSEPEPEPEPEPMVLDPTFDIASQQGTFSDGSQAIAFAVTPDDNVSIVRIDITDPLGNTFLADLQNTNLLAGISYPLQNSGTAYNRISGTWRFRFQGSRTGGDRAAFDVTTPLSIGARVRN